MKLPFFLEPNRLNCPHILIYPFIAGFRKVSLVVANRIQNAFLPDHHEAIDMLIDVVLERLSVD